MIVAVLILVAVGSLMQAARSFFPAEASHGATGTALAFGYLLLSAFFAGGLFANLRLPRLTGYIATGIVVGPGLLALVSDEMVHDLGPVKGVAVCLIALTAGGEFNFARMRPLLRSINAITLRAVFGTAVLCGAALFAMRRWLPFLDGLDTSQAIAACAVVAVAISAMSPAVVMGLFGELAPEGPVSKTILGVVVVADLAVIVLFALVSSVAKTFFGGSADIAATAIHVSWELFGSVLVGLVLGVIMVIFLRKVEGSRALFVVLVCVIASEIGGRVKLDPLIITLTVGVLIENVEHEEASKLIHEIEAASLPVYVVFFALAGAMLDLQVLRQVALPALAMVIVRALGMFVGARWGASSAGADPAVVRWSFVGLLPQAGLALAIALLLPKVFPSFGEQAAALVISVVGINEFVMPIILRAGIVRSGEDAASRGVVPSSRMVKSETAHA